MMKEFKGTKGPWKVLNEDDFIIVHENDESVTFVAACVDDEHDAKLIAAAPDLLEELQLTLGALREICFTCGAARPESTIRRAEAAIAKALGETK